MSPRPLLVLVALFSAQLASAALTLPRVIGDHMVLQAGRPAPIWGWAEPGQTVTVRFGAQEKSAIAAADGRWLLRLDPLDASATPAELTLTASGGGAAPESRTLADILVGEVWLCSGQSNMEKPLGEQRGQKPVFNAEQEIAAADFPSIRLFKVKKTRADSPARDVESDSGWVVCSPATVDTIKFSAAGYFFGRQVHRELGAPVGLIDSTWGGTRIELWTPLEAYAGQPGLEDFAAAAARGPGAKHEGSPLATHYHAMIAPLAPFALRGAIWYQGESNLMVQPEETRYAEKSAALIRGWRGAWGQDFSFYSVLIAPHLYHVVRPAQVVSPEAQPRFWMQQIEAARRVPGAGIIGSTDLVDDLDDIHPRNKRDIGERLARLALAKDYGRADVVWSGPVFRSVEFAQGRATVRFDHADGLAATDNKPLKWFTLAGADGRFFPGLAEIVGDTVVVSSPHVPAPAAVRFAWDEAARPNLANGAGLPAFPFRSDARFP